MYVQPSPRGATCGSSSSCRTASTLAPTVWVPPLRIERRLFLNRRLNAFFKHGEAQLFVARRDGRVVGRISAQFDDAFNAYHDNDWGMFGFLEFEDDPESCRRCWRPPRAGCARTAATAWSARWTSR